MLQLLHPGTGKPTFQSQPDDGAQLVQCNSQHDSTIWVVMGRGRTPLSSSHNAFCAGR
jgi:hypothetical protein